MKKTIKRSVALLALLISSAVSAWAYPVNVGDKVIMYSGDNSAIPYEGNYQAALLTGNTAGDKFGVFCLEQYEYFYPGRKFTVSSIADYAERGGIGAVNGKDYISFSTKWLYSHFLAKDILGLVNGVTATNLDYEIQQAVWYLENEITSISGDSLRLVNAANAASTAEKLAFDVKVMNLTFAENIGSYRIGDFAQSQLIGAPVPEPSTLLLLGLGLAGLTFARRRTSKKQ